MASQEDAGEVGGGVTRDPNAPWPYSMANVRRLLAVGVVIGLVGGTFALWFRADGWHMWLGTVGLYGGAVAFASVIWLARP